MAERITEAVRRRFAADLRAIGVHGSLAHGDDSELSDINLVVVTREAGTGPRPTSRRVDGTVVNLGVIGAEEYLRRARTLTASWPLAADEYLTVTPLYDPAGWYGLLRDTHLARLAEASAPEFASLAREAWCQAQGLHARATRLASWHDTDAAMLVLAAVRLASAMVDGLLARTYFRNSADAVRRTGLAGLPLLEMGAKLRDQAGELARRGLPVDGAVTDLLG